MSNSPGFGYAKLSQTAGTVINALIPAKQGLRSLLTWFIYVATTTAHTLTLMRPLRNADLSVFRAASAATGTTGNLTVATQIGPTGNLMAANDYIAVQETDGAWRTYKVSAVATGNLSFSVTGNLTAGVAIGAKIYNFGVTTDTDPRTGVAHPAFVTGTGNGTSANTGIYTPASGGVAYAGPYAASFVAAAVGDSEPMLLQSDNATGAGTFTMVGFEYARTGA